jgi:hypothetical protein
MMALQRSVRAAGAIVLAAAATSAAAADFSDLSLVPQREFRALSEDLAAAFAYRGITPATPLGTLGFDIGVGLTQTKLENSSVFRLAGSSTGSNLLIPSVHVHKGLPARFDIGAFVAGTNDLDAKLFGAELRYAFLDDTLTTPALGLRLAGTRASGTGDLSFSTASLDLVVSKKLTLFTPYGGGGVVRASSKASGAGLEEERFNRTRFFVGLNVNLLAANIALEAEKMGDNTSLSAKLGFRF